MNKCLAFLFALVLLVARAGATNTAALTTYSPDWEVDTIISDTASNDSINGTTDSTIILNNWTPEPGWEYHLVNDSLTDAGTGSPEFIINVHCLDASNNVMYVSTGVDTLSTTGGSYNLEIGTTNLGIRYDIVLEGGAANGAAEHKLNRCYIMKRRALITPVETK